MNSATETLGSRFRSRPARLVENAAAKLVHNSSPTKVSEAGRGNLSRSQPGQRKLWSADSDPIQSLPSNAGLESQRTPTVISQHLTRKKTAGWDKRRTSAA